MSQLDTGWLDTQYNNRARVPEHMAIIDRWRQASQLVREQSPDQETRENFDLEFASSRGSWFWDRILPLEPKRPLPWSPA